MSPTRRPAVIVSVCLGSLLLLTCVAAILWPTDPDPFDFLPKNSLVYAGPTPEIELAMSGRRYRVYSWQAEHSQVEKAMRLELPRHGLVWSEGHDGWIHGDDTYIVLEEDRRVTGRNYRTFANSEEEPGWVTVYVFDLRHPTWAERVRGTLKL